MRRIGLIDLFVIAALVGLLLFAARSEFGRFAGRGQAPPAAEQR